MECFGVGKIGQRFAKLLLKPSDCLTQQTLRCAATTTTSCSSGNSTATISRCDRERDNTKITACEGHITSQIYELSCARLVFSTLKAAATTTTTITDRPVYPHFIHLANHIAYQQPYTRHARFYCTAKTTRKKMVSLFNISYFCERLEKINY